MFGIKAYWKAILFIKEHKLYWFIAFPAVLMIGIYKIGAYFQQRTLAPKVNNMNEIIWFLIHSIFEISIALLLMNFAKYIVVISLSPLFSHLSQKTEHILTGNKYHFKLDQFIKDIQSVFTQNHELHGTSEKNFIDKKYKLVTLLYTSINNTSRTLTSLLQQYIESFTFITKYNS